MNSIAVIFPGQGSHFVGMYKGLYDQYEIVRQTILEAEQVTGVNIRELCFQGPASLLNRPENAHVAIVAFGVAAFRAFVSESGQVPQFCAGHSLGEYTALVSAGAVSFSDALKLVQLRSRISTKIKEDLNGGMSIIDGINTSVAERICRQQRANGKKVYISCYNSNKQIAISGINEHLEETEDILRKCNGRTTPLFHSAPFHSPLMEEAIQNFSEAAESVPFYESRYIVMSNYTGKPYRNISEYSRNLVLHLTNPVRFDCIMQYLERMLVDKVIDFSARSIFEEMLSELPFSFKSFGTKEGREDLLSELGRAGNTEFLSKCILTAITEPNCNPLSDYESNVRDPICQLYLIKEKLENNTLADSSEVRAQSIHLLKKVFEGKGTDKKLQKKYIDQIVEESAENYNLI